MKMNVKSFSGWCLLILFLITTQFVFSGQQGRYKIVQSEVNPAHTFRLDRCTGKVSRLSTTKEDENVWENTMVQDLPAIQNTTEPRFEIFISSTDTEQIFLIDTKTGHSWVLKTTKMPKMMGRKATIYIWKPFKQ